jgi:hypothetical protein
MFMNYGRHRPVVHPLHDILYEYGAPVVIVTWETEEL